MSFGSGLEIVQKDALLKTQEESERHRFPPRSRPDLAQLARQLLVILAAIISGCECSAGTLGDRTLSALSAKRPNLKPQLRDRYNLLLRQSLVRSNRSPRFVLVAFEQILSFSDGESTSPLCPQPRKPFP